MPKQTLEAVQKRIDGLMAVARRLTRKRAPALRRIVTLARTNGISFFEIRTALAGGGKRRRKSRKPGRRTRKVAPMYRNAKTGETWSGRGRPARWLAAAEKAGRKREEFRIKKR
jgi:DNA-binding protein H-NS